MIHSLLIGGTKGLGRVVAKQFVQRRDSVSVFGSSEIPINDQSAGIVDSYKLDINDSLAVAAGVKEIIAKRGHLNYCVFLQRFLGKGDDCAGEIQTTMTAITEDNANAIEYLCSSLTSFLTGQNIVVDGGLSLVWPETLARKMSGI
jgi:NAD(P)-dependent dehydrogenase (short-subunit alcohol dehydrogenase family)